MLVRKRFRQISIRSAASTSSFRDNIEISPICIRYIRTGSSTALKSKPFRARVRGCACSSSSSNTSSSWKGSRCPLMPSVVSASGSFRSDADSRGVLPVLLFVEPQTLSFLGWEISGPVYVLGAGCSWNAVAGSIGAAGRNSLNSKDLPVSAAVRPKAGCVDQMQRTRLTKSIPGPSKRQHETATWRKDLHQRQKTLLEARKRQLDTECRLPAHAGGTCLRKAMPVTPNARTHQAGCHRHAAHWPPAHERSRQTATHRRRQPSARLHR